MAAKKEALALRKKEKKEQEQREWEEAEARKRYQRLAGASVTMDDVETAGSKDGAVVVSEVCAEDESEFFGFCSVLG